MARKKSPAAQVSLPEKSTSSWHIAVALGLLVLAVFAAVATHDFVGLDDDRYVFENPVVSKGLTAEGLVYAFTTYNVFYWHPVTWLSHMLDCQLFGLQAGGHHATNVLIHLANVLLLFFLLRRMTGAVWRSAIVAAIFAVHPLRVEPVAWIAERKDVLGCLFWLLTIWMYVGKKYFPALAMFVLALMSKPTVVTLPFVLLLLDYWPLERRPRIKEKLPFFALALASSVVTYLGQRNFGAMEEMAHISLGGRIANALLAYVAYLRDVFWPQTLAVNYPYTEIPAVTVAAAALLLLAISVAAVRAAKQRYFAMGWFWFVGTLVPMIGIVQVGMQSRADRFTYIPSIGLFVLLVWGAAELAQRFHVSRAAAASVTAAAILALAWRAWAQVPVWQNTLTLLEHAVAVTEGNALAHYNLGYEYLVQHRPEDAERQFRIVVKLNPNAVNYTTALGNALYEQGKYAEAMLMYSDALRRDPDYATAIAARAMVLKRLGSYDLALGAYRKALARGLPARQAAQAHNDMASIMGGKNLLPEAAAELRQALDLNPGFHAARMNLARVLLAQGQRAEAIREMEAVIAHEPDYPNARQELAEARK